MLWLAVGVLLQPVLGAWGEVHDTAAHSSSTAQTLHDANAVAHDDHHGGVSSHDSPFEEDSGALHLLLHFAHCCGQSVALAVDGLIAPSARINTARLLPPVYVRRLGAHLTSPFRPPIAA